MTGLGGDLDGLQNFFKVLFFGFKNGRCRGARKEHDFVGSCQDGDTHLTNFDALPTQDELVGNAVGFKTAVGTGFFVEHTKARQAGFEFGHLLAKELLRSETGSDAFAAEGDVFAESRTEAQVGGLAGIDHARGDECMNRPITPSIGKVNR